MINPITKPAPLLGTALSLMISPSILAQEDLSFQTVVNNVFETINSSYSPFLFWSVPFIKLPLILFIMLTGGIFFTLRYNFLNIRLFKHGIAVLKGDYDHPHHEGDISHFQALTSSLSATVGLGNIAGVAVAIGAGGPGAVFWLWVAAFFGMSLKFSSCTFAQLYRKKDSKGEMLGGPMVYLSEGLKEKGHPLLGKIFGVTFAIMTIMASFGGGNLFQSNQTYEILKSQFPNANPWVVGITLAFFAGIVLLGGIKRIGSVTSKLVPLMCGLFIMSCLAIIFSNFSEIPSMFKKIFQEAFNLDSVYGGLLGVMTQGLKRASFSNEAGLGSAAIAHSAAKTDEPVREGVVAMIGPFIDTYLVCTMTAMAFSTLGSFMPFFLLIAICIFAYSTVISWSYYGERATEYLFGARFGDKPLALYKLSYVFIIILGPVLSIGHVVEFADLMLLSMAFPNILGMSYMSQKIKVQVDDYVMRYKQGKMKIEETL